MKGLFWKGSLIYFFLLTSCQTLPEEPIQESLNEPIFLPPPQQVKIASWSHEAILPSVDFPLVVSPQIPKHLRSPMIKAPILKPFAVLMPSLIEPKSLDPTFFDPQKGSILKVPEKPSQISPSSSLSNKADRYPLLTSAESGKGPYSPPIVLPNLGQITPIKVPSTQPVIPTELNPPPAKILPERPPVDILSSVNTPDWPQSTLDTQEINVQVGEDVFFQFPKLNWIMTTTKDVAQDAGFQNQSFGPATTSFLFKPKNTGSFTLDFSRQDLVLGQEERKQFMLKVVPQGEKVSNEAKQDNPGLNEILKTGDELERAQKNQEALSLYLTHYEASSTELNSRIAKLLEKNNDDAGASRYWERNLSDGNPGQAEALQKLTSLALRRGDENNLVRYLEMGRNRGLKPDEETFLRSYDIFLSKGLWTEVLLLDGLYKPWYPAPLKEDWYLMLKGRYLEQGGPHRDIRRSVEMYQELQKRFPLSRYWTEAGKRVDFLKRNFFQIQ